MLDMSICRFCNYKVIIKEDNYDIYACNADNEPQALDFLDDCPLNIKPLENIFL